MSRKLTELQRQAIAKRVVEARDRKGLTNVKIGELAGYNERTIRTIAAGEAALFQTYAEVCEAVGLDIADICPQGDGTTGQAGFEYGGYLRAEVEDLVGHYEGFRRRYDRQPGLIRSVFEIKWDLALSRLRFTETQLLRRQNDRDITYFHQGNVYVSRRFRVLHLLSREQGALRLITLHPPEIGGLQLCGAILTQAERRAQGGPVFYVPGMSPLLLRRLPEPDMARAAMVGTIAVDDGAYGDLAASLSEIEKHQLAVAIG